MNLWPKQNWIIVVVFLVAILFAPTLIQKTFATSGACSYHGGVNCFAGADWDGSVICNDGWRDSSVSYYSMVECSGGGGYYYSQPSCPLFSTYDSLSGTCKCNYGYVSSGNSCISEDQLCHNQLGYMSQYDSLSDACKCLSGYVIVGGQCTNANTYCSNNFGYWSSYNSISKQCECDSGYRLSPASGQCMSYDSYCAEQFGYGAEADFTGKCHCKSGYVADAGGSTCTYGDTYCANKYGLYSSFNSVDDICECDSGYNLQNGQCERDQPIIQHTYIPITIPSVPISVPKTQNVESNNPAQVVSPPPPMPKKVIIPTDFQTPSLQKIVVASSAASTTVGTSSLDSKTSGNKVGMWQRIFGFIFGFFR